MTNWSAYGHAGAAIAAHEASQPHGGDGGGPHEHAIADTTGLQGALDGKAATHAHPYSADDHDHDAEYAPTHDHPYAATAHDHAADYSALGHSHSLVDGDIPASIARDTEVTSAVAAHSAAGDPHPGYLTPTEGDAAYAASSHSHANDHARQHSITAAADHSFPGGSTFLRADGTFAAPPGGSEAFPVGSVFLAVVATDPATLLGYGTWEAFGAGRMLVGLDGGDAAFDTVEETGGAKTHQHAPHSGVLAHTHNVTDPGHTHAQQRFPTATGGSTGFTVDTSMSGTPAAANDTGSKVTGLTVNSAGSGSEYTHDAVSHLPPYVVVHMWKRTA